jgi:hypothetical protein
MTQVCKPVPVSETGKWGYRYGYELSYPTETCTPVGEFTGTNMAGRNNIHIYILYTNTFYLLYFNEI